MAEASLRTSRYFCHRCSDEIRPHLPDYTCPRCESGFIEEMASIADEPISTPTSTSITTSTSTPPLSTSILSSIPMWTATSVMSSIDRNWHSFLIGVTSETHNDSNSQRERDTGSR